MLTAVPGEIAGYWYAHKIAGRLPWKKLFEPTIDLCKNGFRVTKYFSEIIGFTTRLSKNEAFRSIFLNPLTNKTYKFNETIKFLQLAKTFEKISENGADVFYNGEISVKIVSENNKMGGILTTEDLKNYKPVNRVPIKFSIDKKFNLFTLPPPSSGVLVGLIINIMSSELSVSNLKHNLFKIKRLRFPV